MKNAIKRAVAALFSSGEYLALSNLYTEFRISHFHRIGLRRIRRMSWSRPPKINLGSGEFLKDGYLNIDLFPGGDLTLDLRRPLPFESDSCEIIFSEHFFEHIDYPNPAMELARECFRVLRPNGQFRLSVPDTEWPLTEYSKGIDSGYFRACVDHSWHPSYCTTRLEHINDHFRQHGEHRFAYDEETLRKVLEGAGFHDVKKVTFDPSLDSSHRKIGSLFMNARKPDRLA
jgi:predicted SAM-dependent methyltransferase